jgi:hypothetical protein
MQLMTCPSPGHILPKNPTSLLFLPEALNDKLQSVPAIGIHQLPNHAGGASQLPQANSIDGGSHPVPPIHIHIHSGYAGGAAQFPQTHPINDKALPLEGIIKSLANAPISAGGSGHFPDPNATNDISLSAGINGIAMS